MWLWSVTAHPRSDRGGRNPGNRLRDLAPLDLHVARLEGVPAGVVAVAQRDPVRVARAWLAVVLHLDHEPVRARPVDRGLAIDERLGTVREIDADDRLDARGLHVERDCGA